MGLILIFLLPVCGVVIWRRRRRKTSVAVPVAIAVYSVVSFWITFAAVVHSLAGVAGVEPTLKATLLAKGISEFMNRSALELILVAPLLVGAYFVDRRLLR